jgi:hypothetical protein
LETNRRTVSTLTPKAIAACGKFTTSGSMVDGVVEFDSVVIAYFP